MRIFNMNILNSGPWGAPPSNSNGGHKQHKPPYDDAADLEDLMRKARDRFGKFNGGGAGQPDGKSGFFMILAVLFVIWMGSGLYRVEPEENAVVLTFGKWTSTRTEPGLGYHMPWPIQEVQKINVAFDRRIEVGFREGGKDTSAKGTIASESMILTGDENIIDINFVVLWRISDAGNYLFKIRDPEVTIKKVAESAMRETIGRTAIQKAMTEARGQVEAETRTLMQKILDEYDSGVAINSVQLLRVDPPAPVIDAFDDVQRARTDMERMKNEADTYRNDIVPRARGDAQKITQDAEAYKKAVIAKAEGEAARFSSIYSSYAQAKDVTEKRIYLDTLQQVIAGSKKIVTSDGKQGPLLPYLPLSAPAAAPQDKKQ